MSNEVLTREQVEVWFNQATPGAVANLLREVLWDHQLGALFRGQVDLEELTEIINDYDDGAFISRVHYDILAITSWLTFKDQYDKADEELKEKLHEYVMDCGCGIGTDDLRERYFASTAGQQYRALCMATGEEPDKARCIALARDTGEEDEEYGFGDDDE